MTKEEDKEDKNPTYDRKSSKNFTTDEAGVNDPKKHATPIESERDSVIFKGGELRGMDGFESKS